MEILFGLKEVFEEWNELGLKYAVLRNYAWLLDESLSPDKDIDVSVSEDDYDSVVEVLKKHGFVLGKQNFSLKHKSWYKVFGTKKIGFDFQIMGVFWNDSSYLGREIFDRRIKKEHIYILNKEDYVTMLICHSILGKRLFRQKYVDEIKRTEFDEYEVYVELCRVFGSFERSLLRELKLGVSVNVPIKKLVFKFIKKHPFTFSRTFFRCVFMSRPNKPVIAFIGPDGSGKTSSINRLFTTLIDEGRRVHIKNMHLAEESVLPIRKVAVKTYQGLKNKEVSFKTKTIYFFGFFIYWLDSVLKYYLNVRPSSARSIVITDRWASDVYLMKHVPMFIRKIGLRLCPKPDLLVYLYNTPDVLMSRRKEHTLEDFRRQIACYSDVFESFVKRTESLMIVTEQESDRQGLIEEVMRFIYAKGF